MPDDETDLVKSSMRNLSAPERIQLAKQAEQRYPGLFYDIFYLLLFYFIFMFFSLDEGWACCSRRRSNRSRPRWTR
jgi:hypothetical protein